MKHELKFDVKLLKPSTMRDAIAIALQVDAKLTELRPLAPMSFPIQTLMHTTYASSFTKLTPE